MRRVIVMLIFLAVVGGACGSGEDTTTSDAGAERQSATLPPPSAPEDRSTGADAVCDEVIAAVDAFGSEDDADVIREIIAETMDLVDREVGALVRELPVLSATATDEEMTAAMKEIDDASFAACGIPVLTASEVMWPRPGKFCETEPAIGAEPTPDDWEPRCFEVGIPETLPCFGPGTNEGSSGWLSYRPADCDTGQPVFWDEAVSAWITQAERDFLEVDAALD